MRTDARASSVDVRSFLAGFIEWDDGKKQASSRVSFRRIASRPTLVSGALRFEAKWGAFRVKGVHKQKRCASEPHSTNPHHVSGIVPIPRR